MHSNPRYKIVRSKCQARAWDMLARGKAFARPHPDRIDEIPMNINIHDKAPEFTLQDENGKEVSLKDLRGKTVILFFYPRANTPG
jgi:cytochrome oxidase Cu insertion factor (SCO1/SenC/PrrC family)